MKRTSSVVAAVVGLLAVACASEAPSSGEGLSPEMRQAIDTFVQLQADPAVPSDRAEPTNPDTKSPTANATTSKSSLGGINLTTLSGALTAGASGIPAGGPASGASAAGNGGVGAGTLAPGGPASGGTGAGNGGAAAGSGAGGGLATFADAACYMIGRLCLYITRCTDTEADVCAVPSSCPAVVAEALAKAGNPPIPPQAGVIIRCVGDAIASATCVREDLASGLKSSLQRCGIQDTGAP